MERVKGGERSVTLTEPASGASTDLARGAMLGRYFVLDTLGAGGWGVVYSAYDPDLDRKLAIKLLRADAPMDQSRLLREARALARLQHPHVVAVFDVGTLAGRIFVAMELVDGTTLQQWLQATTRSWREIVALFVQAGRGLAAAHSVGLVHRDFKPSNVLVGRDGRARVVDFGLARSVAAEVAQTDADDPARAGTALLEETNTQAGVLLGTPAYMSPEQLQGLPSLAQSDQFSFCVALHRALYGERPFAGETVAEIREAVTQGRLRPVPRNSRVPGWIREVLSRGLSLQPDQRWPSMDALLAALLRDPEKRRRRWLVGAGATLAIAGAAVLARGTQRGDVLACRDGAQRLVGVWDDARRHEVRRAFTATGKPYAADVAAVVSRTLDAYTGAWAAMRGEACEAAHVRHEQSYELLDLRMDCLGQRLQDVKAQVDLFVHADGDLVGRAVEMATSLPSLSACANVAALRAPEPPPGDAATRVRITAVRDRLARAQALNLAGRYAESLAVAQPLVEEAAALKYRPLEAQALAALGKARLNSGDAVAGARSLQRAALVARAGRDGLTEVNAWASLVLANAEHGRYEEAETAGQLALASFTALGGNDERPLAYAYETLGVAAIEQAKYEEAVDYDQRALAIRERIGPEDSIDVATSLSDTGAALVSLHRYAEAERLLRRAVRIYEKQLGPQHPEVAYGLNQLAFVLESSGHDDEALQVFRRVVAIDELALGSEHPWLSFPLVCIGDILIRQGHYDEGLAAARRALAIAEKGKGPEHPRVAEACKGVGDGLRAQHRYSEALPYYRRALAIWQKVLHEDSGDVAGALTGMALAQLATGEPAPAVPALERALAIEEKRPVDAAAAAETRFALARALWQTGGDRARARRLATDASRELVSAGARGARGRDEIEAWLAAHR